MLSSMGDVQLSAASLASQFFSLFNTCCMGIGMGASVLTARFWGMGDVPSLKRAVTIMFRFCLAIGGTFGLVVFLFPEMVMRIYTSDPDLIRYGASYLAWIAPTFLCLGFSLPCTIVLRSIGEVRIPLVSSAIGERADLGDHARRHL